MTAGECIGCGYCCRKAPCHLAVQAFFEWTKIDLNTLNAHLIWEEHGCPSLEWDGERWRCGLFVHADKELQPVIGESLSLGEGCCANLNTYRRKCHVPTPEELKDEKALLDRLHQGK